MKRVQKKIDNCVQIIRTDHIIDNRKERRKITSAFLNGVDIITYEIEGLIYDLINIVPNA